MLGIKIFVFVISLLLMVVLPLKAQEHTPVTGSAAQIQNVDSYWITFSGDCGCDDFYIMKIDQLGNILVPPKAVLAIADVGANTAALSKNGTSKLNLYYWNKAGKLSRVILDNTALNVLSKKNTKIATKDGEFLQVTQKDKGNYILGERLTGPLALYQISSTHVPKNPGWDIDANITMTDDEASMSADGLVVATNRSDLDANTPDQLFVQLLDDKGVPQGSAKLIAKYTDIEATDVTNELPNGIRFVVYVVDSGTTPDDKLFLQKIDSTGNKKGNKILINTPPNREENKQTVAIDPLGRFVVFTIQGDKFGCYGQDILMYQALADTGKKSGPLKVLAGCNYSSDDIQSLDILKE